MAIVSAPCPASLLVLAGGRVQTDDAAVAAPRVPAGPDRASQREERREQSAPKRGRSPRPPRERNADRDTLPSSLFPMLLPRLLLSP
jgi:hypothetical protein